MHYANTNLKEKEVTSDMDEHYYPLYIEIIYRRQHIQIKSIIDKTFTENLQNVNETDRKLMALELERVNKIIRFDEKIMGNDHKLKGIGNRYTNYNGSVFTLVDDGLRIKLKKIVRQYWLEQSGIINFDLSLVPIGRLFAATKSLWPRLGEHLNLEDFEMEINLWEIYFEKYPRIDLGKYRYPAFIDWMSDKHLDRMTGLLVKKNNIRKNLIHEVFGKVDKTIRSSTIDQ